MQRNVFGKVNVTPNDKPTLWRSSTLEYHKKAISYFMPNNTTKWDVKTNTENPTMSELLTKCIVAVEQKDVRGEGNISQQCHDLTMKEFNQVIDLSRNENDPTKSTL